MRVLLMHPDEDFDPEGELPVNADALSQDLELETLLSAMANGDALLYEVSRRALLLGLRDTDAIAHRQKATGDCLRNPPVVRELYALAGEALEAQKHVWGGLYRDSPQRLLSTSVQKLQVLVAFLARLREIAREHAPGFDSPAFARLFAMVASELDEPYLERVDRQLSELKLRGGTLLSARLGAGNVGTGYMLRRPQQQSLLARVLDRSGYSFTIPDRDESGFKALGELQDRGLDVVAQALAQSLEHVLAFFTALRTEIGFYVACLNLAQRLAEYEQPTTLPHVTPAGGLELSAAGLYDICLALTLKGRVVGNDLQADGRSLIVITGANQGGKSTFLRGLGLAQLMAQSGMFVGARSLTVSVCDAIFTHFKREEDESLRSGKLDEELSRMSEIADRISPGAMLLCNESFASTNEREGSQIARQVVHALVDERIRVLLVTHMFDLASGLYRERLPGALFLRAQRGEDNGTRTYRLTEGEPLPTSHGADSYRRVFGRPLEHAHDALHAGGDREINR